MQREQVEREQRADERLGGGHAYLRAGPEHQRAIRDPGGLCAGVVAERQLARAPMGGLLHGGQRVHRLARLGHRHDERASVYGRLPVAELGGVVGLGGYAGERLHPHAANHGGVETGSHTQEDDAVDLGELGGGVGYLVQRGGQLVEVHATAQGIDGGLGLLVNFLEHEVAESPLGRGASVVGSGHGRLANGLPVNGRKPGVVPADGDHLAVFEVGHRLGVAEQRGQVAREQHLVLAVADHDAAGVAEPHADDGAGLAPGHCHEGVGAANPSRGGPHGVLERQPVGHLGLDEVGDALGVRL